MKRPSPALVISFVALLVALGGTSYAVTALPKGSVGTTQLKNGAVVKKKISAATRRALKGNRGATGAVGPQGIQGLQGPKGDKGDKGDAGATTVIRRIGAIATIGPDNSADATASCNPGETVVSGGGIPWNGSTADFDMIGSFPVAGAPDAVGTPTAWQARYFNRDVGDNNAGNIDVRAYVVCASP